jgi:hypothetical protein
MFWKRRAKPRYMQISTNKILFVYQREDLHYFFQKACRSEIDFGLNCEQFIVREDDLTGLRARF